MRFAAWILLLGLVLVIGCRSETEVKSEIAALELALQQEPNTEILDTLIGLYDEMAGLAKGEERLEYIWKRGEAARSAGQIELAETSFEELYMNHPESPQAPKALFLHAFMCDEDLKNYDKAKVLYTQFLEKHPESDFSDDAQFLLQNLGKSDEEMLEILSKRNPGG